MKITMSAVVLLLTGLFAFAQESKKPEPCSEAQTQTDMNMCWGNQYRAADARLNQVYRQFMTKLDDGEKAQLKNAQSAWLKISRHELRVRFRSVQGRHDASDDRCDLPHRRDR
jgi:uncharacterized protein YecT (DUF1311 family)